MPTAADTKFWTARPIIWARCPIAASPEYDCQFVLVTNDVAVLKACPGSMPANPRDNGSPDWIAQQEVEAEHADQGERQERTRVDGPALIRLGVDADQPVDATLDPGVLVAGVDAGHVRPEGAVGRRQGDDQEAGLEEAGDSVGHQNLSGKSRAATR